MIDRIALGYVVDFIDFRLINFAVFGLAINFVAALATKEGESLNQKAVNLLLF